VAVRSIAAARTAARASAVAAPRPAGRDHPGSIWLGRVAQPLRLGQRLELLERVVLDLADPLARHVEGLSDLLERPRALAGQP